MSKWDLADTLPFLRVHACDKAERYNELKEEFSGRVLRPGIYAVYRRVAKSYQKNVHIFPNGYLVSRSSDYIIYSVEAEAIDMIVAQYGPCMPPCVFSMIMSNGLSHEARCHCWRSDLMQGS